VLGDRTAQYSCNAQVSRMRNIRNLYPAIESGPPHPELIYPVEGLVPVVELFNRLLEEKS